jgi:hypothetical protein
MALSAVNDNWFFIQFQDSSIAFSVPKACYQKVNDAADGLELEIHRNSVAF